MQIALLKSLNPQTLQDFPLTPGELMIGRSPKSGIILQDIRCSGFHCLITPQQTSSWEFLIKDLSSNGTYVNGQLVRSKQVGRGNTVKASFNDKVEILTVSRGVQPGSEIGFIIQSLEKRKNSESATQKMAKNSESAVEEQATCTICYEIMVDPLVLYPCLHTFCELCYLDWKTRSQECPICRSAVREVQKNKIIESFLGIISEKHPEKLKVPEKCFQCEVKVNNFKCSPGQKHLKCSKCSSLMAKRENEHQQCEECQEVHCNLYLKNCATGLILLNDYFSKDFFLPLGALSNNYEENLLSDYLKAHKLAGPQLIETVKTQSHFRLSQNSSVCERCLENVKSELFDKLLEIAVQDHPFFTKTKCPKGRQCLLQVSVLHSQVFSHF